MGKGVGSSGLKFLGLRARPGHVPRPKEEEKEKRAWFQPFAHALIAVEFHRLRILLIYFRMLVTPESILNVTLSVDLW